MAQITVEQQFQTGAHASCFRKAMLKEPPSTVDPPSTVFKVNQVSIMLQVKSEVVSSFTLKDSNT